MVTIPARRGGTFSLWCMTEVAKPANPPAAKPETTAITGAKAAHAEPAAAAALPRPAAVTMAAAAAAPAGNEPSTVRSAKSSTLKLMKTAEGQDSVDEALDQYSFDHAFRFFILFFRRDAAGDKDFRPFNQGRIQRNAERGRHILVQNQHKGIGVRTAGRPECPSSFSPPRMRRTILPVARPIW